MNGLSCYTTKNNMPHAPFTAQQQKGWCSYVRFAASRTGIITIFMDTIFVVSIFVIPALSLLHGVLCLILPAAILTFLMIPPHNFTRAKEQP